MTHEDEIAAVVDASVARDGSPVLLYRRLPPRGEPAVIDGAIAPRSTILELGAGAGRVTHALVELGHHVTAVDDSAEMLRWIRGAETVNASIQGLNLGRRFDVVVLGSHLINVPDLEERASFLATCRRHVRDGGSVLVEHHETDWAERAIEQRSEVNGVVVALTDVRQHPPFVSAEMVYEVDGHVFHQPFTAQVLAIDDMEVDLKRAGLGLGRQLNARWLEALPIPETGPAGT